MDEKTREITTKIKALIITDMELKSITRAELARLSGIRTNSVYRIFYKDSSLKMETMIKLCKALNLEITVNFKTLAVWSY